MKKYLAFALALFMALGLFRASHSRIRAAGTAAMAVAAGDPAAVIPAVDSVAAVIPAVSRAATLIRKTGMAA